MATATGDLNTLRMAREPLNRVGQDWLLCCPGKDAGLMPYFYSDATAKALVQFEYGDLREYFVLILALRALSKTSAAT